MSSHASAEEKSDDLMTEPPRTTSPPPLPSFPEYVLESWHCNKEDGDVYDKTLALAETMLFGRLDGRDEVEAVAAVKAGDVDPQHGPGLLATPSFASSVKDDEDPGRPRLPLLERLDILAAEYFGRHWDRVDEIVRVNQRQLEAWKADHAPRAIKGEGQDSGWSPRDYPPMEMYPSLLSSSSSSLSASGSSLSRKRPKDPPPSPPSVPSKETDARGGNKTPRMLPEVGSVVEVGEGAIDWLLGGLPGPAVPYGRETSVPGLCQAELILLEVYSDNCPACHRLKPALSQAAAAFQDRPSVLFVAVDGPANPAFLERLDVQWYPTLKLIHRKRNMLWDWPVIPRGGLTAADILAVVEKYLDTPCFPPGVEAAGVPLEQTGEGGGEDGGEGKGEEAQTEGAEGGNGSNGPIHVASEGPHKEMSDVEGGGGGHTAALFSRSVLRKEGNEEEDEGQRGSRGKERGERIAEDSCTSNSAPPDRNPPPPAQGQAPHDEHQDPPAHDLEGRLARDQLAVKRTQLLKSLAEGPPSEPPPSFSQLSQFRRARRCPRDLVSRRRWVSAREIFKALGCHDEASCRALSRSQRQDREEPPHLILLGGGMGAGKTTLKKMVSQSEFWRRHGQNVVSVEADHFKEIDPVYQLLTRLNQPKASEAVHTYSTQAAEELFLSALKFKRDIIFDSTLAWAPFLSQTLAMVRDTKHQYKRGPGYVRIRTPSVSDGGEGEGPGGTRRGEGQDGAEASPEGTVVAEKYWEVESEVSEEQMATSYRVELVGVYVRPEVAVRRAIIRRLLTGRGVPVREQLRSHALFAKNFETFALQFDTVLLYDNNRRHEQRDVGKGGEASGGGGMMVVGPRVIARKDLENTELQILDPEAFRAFQAVANINVDATSVEELYSDENEDVIKRE